MFSVQSPEGAWNLWDAPNLLLQKFPAPEFTATTKVTFNSRLAGERFGLVVMGMDYAHLSVTNRDGKLWLAQTLCRNADKRGTETSTPARELSDKTFYLRVRVEAGAVCRFSYSLDGQVFTPVGEPFTAREGRWIGAKVGLFVTRAGKFNDAGSAEVDWFRVTANE